MQRQISSDLNYKAWGDVILYFGCRNSNEDELYENEIRQMIEENVINKYYPAYSRGFQCKKVFY